MSWIGKFRDIKQISGCLGLTGVCVGGGMWLLKGTGFFEGDENVLKLIVVMVVQHCEYMKTSELYILNE